MWLHRYCAGIPSSRFAAVASSFICSACSITASASIVAELRSEIAALKEEVSELRAALRSSEQNLEKKLSLQAEALATSQNSSNTWTEVVCRGRRQTAVTDTTTGSRSKHQPPANQHSQQQRTASKRPQRHSPMQGVSVPGARRIWGTLKSTTTRAVENVITTLTKVSGSELKIKRKYKTATGSSARVVRWWFVVRAEESVLEQVQKEWNQVAMQTDWKLTPLLQHAKPITEAQLHVEQPTPSLGDVTKSGPGNSEKSAPSGMQQVSSNNLQSSQAAVNTNHHQAPSDVQHVSSNDTPIHQSSQSAVNTGHQSSTQKSSPQTGIDHTQITSQSQTCEQGHTSTSPEQTDGNNFLGK